MDDDTDDDWLGDEEETFPCPECAAEVHAEAEACPSCGYWITDADREAGWRDGSAFGQFRAIGLWVLGLAAIVWLLLWW